MTTTEPLRAIYVDFTIAGLHQYDNAPDPVRFLKYPHHHDFHFRVTIAVTHEHRELEFIMVRNTLSTEMYKQFNAMYIGDRSCEMLAHVCHDAVQSLYGNRGVRVDVSEDGGPGGIYSTL